MDEIITVRIPPAIIEAADIAVKDGLYKNRTEALVACMRTGMKHVFFNFDDIKNRKEEVIA